MEDIRARCCVAGGGPAGMMLAFLLARAGVDVVVLEKHADFLRDFRGDTVHPSTLEIMHELGLLDVFLERPHQELRRIIGQIGDTRIVIGEFTGLRLTCPFIALMPQWDFLNFLAEQARRYPAFRLLMRAEVTDLIEENGTVAGVRATTLDGPLEVRADLVVGCDGRHSTVRERAGLEVRDLGAPIDVLWMRISKRPEDGAPVLGRFDAGRLLVTLDRGDYWQCAYVIRKGGFEELKTHDVQVLRDDIAAIAPFLRERVGEIRSWDDVKLLTVTVDRLKTWYRPGLICIGDAAHAMSPIGGVGINLAIQDAVATANILAARLAARTVRIEDLHAVQKRRTFPVAVTQAGQVFVQERIFVRVLGSTRKFRAPWPLKLLNRFPFLRRFPARFVGVGVRPEHVRTPEAGVSSRSA
ncbi:MAG TPA: FAD-dependent oxidoreductase [Candidatus Elarobacter sp.]|jgi:2-polyprenyl-6-methoxyphenol hydroxylase-like FAD-dependent oxidoreductase|nr:FAD-dependent oxidoreductase [Candidatus Elarobacter sp.]